MSVAAQFEANASEDLSSPFYFNPSHWRAMDGIVEGVKDREGIMVMTGPTGSGKTMLMRAISENLGEGVTPLFLQYASLNFREFVNFLHNSLNVGDEILDASNKAVALRKFLYAQAERKETAVVFIDEAQNVEPDVLRMLPKLACFDQLEDGTNVGLQFMLTGGSELREILEDSDFDQVQEVIARSYELRFFTREELKYFLDKRLAPLARLTPEPITNGAIETVGKYTGGSPRLMGMICSHAMLFAAENPGRSIDESMIEEAAEALMIEPVENPFSHEANNTEVSGPYSSAEIRGEVDAGGVTSEVDQLSTDTARQEADAAKFDAPIGDSVNESYDENTFIDKNNYEDEFDTPPSASVMDQIGMGMDVESMSNVVDEDEFEFDEKSSSKALAGAAGAAGLAGLAGGSLIGRVKSVFSRGKKLDVSDKMGDMVDAGSDALGDAASSASAVGGSAMSGIKSVFSRSKKIDLTGKTDDMFDDELDVDDEFLSAEADTLSDKVSSVGAAGGSAMTRARKALSGRKSGETAQIVGAGRKSQNGERSIAPAGKRAMKTRVAGQRKQQLKYASYAAGFCALAFGAYMVRTDVSNVVASATDSVTSTASSAFDTVASAGSEATEMFTGGFDGSTTSNFPQNDESVAVASLDPGSVDVTAPVIPEQAAPAVPQAVAPVKKSGWGAKVEVGKPVLSLPELSLPDAPKLPETGVSLTRGALDLVDSVLDKGKEVLPDDVKAALDVASADVQELRTAATVNGASAEEQAAKVSELVSKADDFFARQLYIAPRGGNAYDSYRAALDIDPDNAAAARGIENLRSFYSKKAEAARAQKQWDRANRHFGTALAISQRKGVR